MNRKTGKMTKTEVVDRLLPILNRISLKEDNYIETNFDKPLTGNFFSFSAIDMAYLYFEVLQEFHMPISQEVLCKYGFNTINDIIKIILKGE